jgi:hypothetical protein
MKSHISLTELENFLSGGQAANLIGVPPSAELKSTHVPDDRSL